MGGKGERKDPKDEFTVDYLGCCVTSRKGQMTLALTILIRIKLMGPFRIDACPNKKTPNHRVEDCNS